MDKRDLIFSPLLLALGIGVTVESFQMPRMQESGSGDFAAPGLVPGIIGIALAILAFLLLMRTIFGKKDATTEPTPVDPAERKRAFRSFVVTLGLTLIYALLMVGTLPFALATFLFLFAFISYFEWEPGSGRRRVFRLTTAAAQAVVVAFAVTYLFEEIFKVTLPR